ncbi:competence protein ComK [Alkalibacterium olivapovliticus]|uniref:ComK protein n=1 Tax=Alkalibacterium olivapovliticus TaxID=99907 RepID=A0A2T0W758_9LACT|nr:competence protein ComK [Alkalibacterium olivapovliticus]PRY82519.1 ComK protein [Alkalibacterium olivapovliticus]
MTRPNDRAIDMIYKDFHSYYTQTILTEGSNPFQTGTGRYIASRTLSIKSESYFLHLNEAIEQTPLFLTKDSFYIQDISHLSESPYNTLVYQICGSILKTEETTSQVMKRYFQYLKVDYTFIQRIGKCIGINQRCPYVVGEVLFAPEKGSIKNNSSWIAFHHVVYLESISSHLVSFKIRKYHELILPLSYKRAADMIQKTTSLYHTTKAISIDLQEKFTSRYQDTRLEDMHIIKKNLTHQSLGQPTIELTTLFEFLSLHRANDMLQTVLGEDNPYMEDLRKQFPLPTAYKSEYT